MHNERRNDEHKHKETTTQEAMAKPSPLRIFVALLGFLAPAFSRILAAGPLEKGQGPLALIMAPTRALAQQLVLGDPNPNPSPNQNPS